MPGNIFAAVAGFFLIAVTMRDVFQIVVVPRAIANTLRISRFLFRTLWAIWPPLAYRLFKDDEKREDFLATFAPFTLVCMLAVWVIVLVLGFGLIFYGLRSQLRPDGASMNFGDAVYYAGTSLLTLGYGDITAHTLLARIISLVAAASGLSVVALVVTFLFSIFGEFQSRERFIVSLGARAGSPPSGVDLLVVHYTLGIANDLAGVFRVGQGWTAEVMESHLAYPALVYFRSSHDYQSWIGTLGTLLDAAILVITTLEGVNAGQARIMYTIGRHLTRDFAHYFHLDVAVATGIERAEFDRACDRLVEAGCSIADRDIAWARFSELRSTYAGELNALARWLEIPPIEWISDRSLIDAQHVRTHLPPVPSA